MNSLPAMVPFYDRFPELAARETRVITLLTTQAGLPAGSYGFIEMFCNDPKCDCRRVVIQVRTEHAPNKVLATINYGWESLDFYTRWMHGDVETAREIISPSLDPLNQQSPYSGILLALFKDVVSNDPAYVQRLARHYKIFKKMDNKPKSPPGNK